MKGIASILFIVVVLISNLVAQNVEEPEYVIVGDERIESLVQLHIDHNIKHPVFQGYRIQILMATGNDALDITEEAKTKFLEKYPETRAYLTFDEPDYRVRVGDFRTRLEAEKFLEKIDRKYPGAWVIQDYINFPELSKYKNTNSYE